MTDEKVFIIHIKQLQIGFKMQNLLHNCNSNQLRRVCIWRPRKTKIGEGPIKSTLSSKRQPTRIQYHDPAYNQHSLTARNVPYPAYRSRLCPTQPWRHPASWTPSLQPRPKWGTASYRTDTSMYRSSQTPAPCSLKCHKAGWQKRHMRKMYLCNLLLTQNHKTLHNRHEFLV